MKNVSLILKSKRDKRTFGEHVCWFEVSSVGRIVQKLDKLPLAIELAAARMNIFNAKEIETRLNKRFSLLRSRQEGIPTLSAALDWSWDLLKPWQKATLSQSSIFRGGFDIDAAESVLKMGDWSESSTIFDSLQDLCEDSLLLQENAGKISTLRDAAAAVSADAPSDGVFYLRYCLDPSLDDADAKAKVEANVGWRSSDEGRLICDAARGAIADAMSDGGWSNAPVRSAAPKASVVNDFITSDSIITTHSRQGDLAYCVRSSNIDVDAMMSKISQSDMESFFLYAKEINAVVADLRSAETDRLVCVFTVNDLSGVKLVGGDASFRKALSASSQKANELYPSLSGPTLLLNLLPLPPFLGRIKVSSSTPVSVARSRSERECVLFIGTLLVTLSPRPSLP